MLSSCIQDLISRLGEISEVQPEEAPDGPPLWEPDPKNKPQRQAYESPADEIYFGGEPGGGKSELILGIATTQARKSLILRRQATQLQELVERLKEIVGYPERGQWRASGHGGIMRTPDGRTIELAGCDEEKDKEKYKGRPHDFKGYDELPDFAESQYTFINIWNRTTMPGQRCRIVGGGNPPTTPEGEWVLRRWAAWLDPKHPNPAKSGELRWYAMVDGAEVERPDGQAFQHVNRKGETETIVPRSRTFIRSGLADNRYLNRDGEYRALLQQLPEPLRSIFLEGNFQAGRQDDPWQVIPTDWVKLAQARWTASGGDGLPMDVIGVDVARGGGDQMVLSARHGTWYAPLIKRPGAMVPTGDIAAQEVLKARGHGARIQIDVIGVGSSPTDILKMQDQDVLEVNFAAGSKGRDKSGKLKFRNIRAEAYWRLREALDPVSGENLALPDDPELLADLCAPRWKLSLSGIQIEDKDDVKKRIGRSPDCADALVIASYLPDEPQAFDLPQAMPVVVNPIATYRPR